MPFSVFITNTAKKSVKKLSKEIRQEVVSYCVGYIAKFPFDSEQLKSPLDDCRSFHFKKNNVHYRIAYRIVESENRIDVILVGARENFYERLKRIIS